MGFWAHTVFWSLAANLTAFGLVSLYTRPGPLEAAQAERFVGVFGRRAPPPSTPLTAPALTPEGLEELVGKFTGRDKARAEFGAYLATREVRAARLPAAGDPRELLQFAERTLSGSIGTASAQAILEGLRQAATGRFETIVDVFGRVSRSLEQSREDLQRRVRELSLINEATWRVASTLEPQSMMDGIVELLAREFEFDVLTVRLRDADGRLRIKSHRGLPAGTDLSAGDPVSRDTYFGECLLEARAVVVEDTMGVDRPLVLPGLGRATPRSFVHAPILIEERPIGVLSAYSSTGRVYFTPEFLQFLRTLAVQLGLGLRNAQLYRELGDLSRALEGKVALRTAELEEANRRLQELDRLKSDFVSTVSHELRTPLTSIRSLSESLLLARDMPRDRQEQLLDIIAQESQRLSRMINQLLDLSRIEAGKMEWRLESLDLDEAVHHAVQANLALFTAKGVNLSERLRARGGRVMGDRDQIIQVLTNLLSNAAKFTAAGGRVEIRTFLEHPRAIVEVEDSGKGIPADQLEAVFDRFRQVGDTLTAKPEGAGLGLPISREIVHAHGGGLTVRSRPGQGSCFRVSLPLIDGRVAG
jgi:signal transduction histidine kinase